MYILLTAAVTVVLAALALTPELVLPVNDKVQRRPLSPPAFVARRARTHAQR